MRGNPITQLQTGKNLSVLTLSQDMFDNNYIHFLIRLNKSNELSVTRHNIDSSGTEEEEEQRSCATTTVSNKTPHNNFISWTVKAL